MRLIYYVLREYQILLRPRLIFYLHVKFLQQRFCIPSTTAADNTLPADNRAFSVHGWSIPPNAGKTLLFHAPSATVQYFSVHQSLRHGRIRQMIPKGLLSSLTDAQQMKPEAASSNQKYFCRANPFPAYENIHNEALPHRLM